MNFLLGLIIGLIVGGSLGIMVMSLLISGSDVDDQLLGDEQYNEHN